MSKPTIIVKFSELRTMPLPTKLALGELRRCVTRYFNKLDKHRRRTRNIRVGIYKAELKGESTK